MNGLEFSFHGTALVALPSGGLYWPDQAVLVVSDLHLGKSERVARRTGMLLPPFEVIETLEKLTADIQEVEPSIVICLGDSFDDLRAAEAVGEIAQAHLAPVMAGRRWIWIEGNHDPGPIAIAGEHLAECQLSALHFRHIATTGARGEVSGHYHPKMRLSVRGRSLTRRCFLFDANRLILPAYGTYTGGLFTHDKAIAGLMGDETRAILLGKPPVLVPFKR